MRAQNSGLQRPLLLCCTHSSWPWDIPQSRGQGKDDHRVKGDDMVCNMVDIATAANKWCRPPSHVRTLVLIASHKGHRGICMAAHMDHGGSSLPKAARMGSIQSQDGTWNRTDGRRVGSCRTVWCRGDSCRYESSLHRSANRNACMRGRPSKAFDKWVSCVVLNIS